ncbi:MAG: class I SAM-dependent methyltransferase [Candidatus Berkelbacteria bacterium]
MLNEIPTQNLSNSFKVDDSCGEIEKCFASPDSSSIPHSRDPEFKDMYQETMRLSEKVADHIAAMLQFQDGSLEADLIEKAIMRQIAEKIGYFNEGKVDLAAGSLNSVNLELANLLSYPPTLQGFMDAQLIIDDFLREPAQPGNQELNGGLYAQEIISQRLKNLYDNPDFNLRDYEGLTTDTTVSLEYLLKELALPPTLSGRGEDHKQLTIFDLGTGEGRFAIPLAALGHRVNCIDISKRMLDQVDERTELFWDGFTHKRPDKLAESARKAFEVSNVLPKVNTLGDLRKNIRLQQGSFFDIDSEDYDKSFGPQKADVAIMMWHTFGFAGDHEGQMKTLKNIYDNVRPGGIVVIEMPDRDFGGYGKAIREYQQAQLKTGQRTSFGAIVDAPSKDTGNPTEQNEENETPRYFPDKLEMIETLEDANFNFADRYDYFVEVEDNNGKKLAVLEHLYVVVRPEGMSMKNIVKQSQALEEDKINVLLDGIKAA